MVVDRADITEIVQKACDLSGLPDVTHKVISIANSPESDAGDLEQALRLDPSLAARVIRVANSAYYAQPGQIKTIHSAVVLLGFDTIKNVALAASISELFKGKCETEGYSRSALWEHMVSVAATARMIARRIRYPDPEEAFLAGIVHDIGMILADLYLHDGFLSSVAHARQNRCSLIVAEREVMGVDHAFIGARLARAWNFPKEIRYAVAFHHEPDKAGAEGLQIAMLIHLSDALSKMVEKRPMGDNNTSSLHRQALPTLNLKPMDVKVLHQDLADELAGVQEFYGLIAEG